MNFIIQGVFLTPSKIRLHSKSRRKSSKCQSLFTGADTQRFYIHKNIYIRNDNLKKNWELLDVRVEFGLGAVRSVLNPTDSPHPHGGS